MTDHTRFLATIARNPADMGPRLVFADWLEERGDPRGEFIRLAIEDAENPSCTKCKTPSGLPANPIWRTGCQCEKRRTRLSALLAEHRRVWTMAGLATGWTWCKHHAGTGVFGFHVNDERGNYNRHVSVDFTRGMPEILTLRFDEWQRHYQTLIDAMPVREVRLTTMPNILNYAVSDEGTFKVSIVIEINGNWYRADATSFDIAVITILKRAFPGRDAARPIRYTLPDPVLHGDGSALPRGIDPRTIFPYRAETSVGGIP